MDMVSVSVARFFLRRSTGFLAFIFLFYYSGGTPLVNSPMICGSKHVSYLILSYLIALSRALITGFSVPGVHSSSA